MAEGARLESVYTVFPYRGFESLSLRQYPLLQHSQFTLVPLGMQPPEKVFIPKILT